MLVFLRLPLSTSIRGFEPWSSCFVLLPARMMSRKRESIPGHVPSLATPVGPLPFTFSLIAIFLFLYQDCRALEDRPKKTFISGQRNFRNRKTVGTNKPATARICSQFIADFLQLGQRILHSASILPQ